MSDKEKMETLLESVRILKSETCFCGKPKEVKKAFCLGCFRTLPPQIQNSLYKPVGNGFEKAIADAKKSLTDTGRIK